MRILLLASILVMAISNSIAQDCQSLDSKKISVEKIFEHKGVIWGFDFINPDLVIFTKREGELFSYDLKSKSFKKLVAPEVWSSGQGGLLDVLVNGKDVYITFSKPHEKTAVTALAKGQWSDGDLPRLETIFQSNAYSTDSIHFGSRVVIDEDKLFMSVGERNKRELAESLKHHHGKILRLTLDGKAYPGNPFVKNGLPEIYSYGHRNPQGLVLHPESKALYAAEFGPRGGDEVNLIMSGKNYGWPEITYGREYWGPSIGQPAKEGMEQPLVHWTPSISPSGITIYSGNKNANFKGNFFLAALGSQYVHRLVFGANHKVELQQKWLEDLNQRVRQIKEGPDGQLYFCTDSGQFYRINMDKIKF